MGEGITVGIDLGTTYSCAAIVENGRARVISDTGGSFIIPSVVAVDDKGNRLVGQAAKRQSLINPIHTVQGAKRLIGRDISSHVVDEFQDHFKYELEPGEHSDVLVKIREEAYGLDEISAFILDYVRNSAQDLLGQEISRAVVTVPAYFNDRQRQAVRDAGKIAHLDIIRIINEPTAAALAYGYGKSLNQKLVIYDLGGGTFDISLLELRNNVFEVKATGGNTFLGGVDFDNRLARHIFAKFKEQTGVDPSRDPMAFQRIQDAAEQAKLNLSTTLDARIHIPFIATGPQGPLNIDMSVTRAEFEALIKDLVDKTLVCCRQVLTDANLQTKDIDAVLLVGGSTRIPMVAQTVEKFFGKPPSKGIHPDEAVALGAAILAHSLTSSEGQDITLLDVLPITIGLHLPNGKVMPLFKRNTSIPNQVMKKFTTSKDNQTSLKIKLVQGDSENADECEIIGDFTFEGIHPATKGLARVEVVFTLSQEGILTVSARDPDTGTEQEGVLQVSSGITKLEHRELIQSKKPVPRKDAEKLITTQVTREVKLKAATAAPGQTKPAAAAGPARHETPPPPKPQRKPEKEGLSIWGKIKALLTKDLTKSKK